ncbi:PIN domain-containing protein [Solitalea lacus]|uniref:PIN domain-containing protein n=1 Tax=Solitalea lacus TaxID=2911172 RepID=UPI001EDAC9AB|nr:PIN domain-containing protein [Solitalea lacus]UKJ07363.1 PIN domain-containing protein [Solitalea lacus]
MNIINLHNNSSPKERYYLLDSNVWLPILGIDDEPTSEHYKIFFDKILKHDIAKILLCPLQLSELLNRLLRFHGNKAFGKKYKGKTGVIPSFSEFYKAEYRGSNDYKIRYESIIDDLDGYSSHIVFTDVHQKTFLQLTSFDASKLDFNDHYLYVLAKEQSAMIVTHDADFFGLDVSVGTFNLKLYKAYTSSIQPKK